MPIADLQTGWLEGLKSGLERFLDSMKVEGHPGFYRYTRSGDLYGPNRNWGLANAVFATKIRYMIGDIGKAERDDLTSFISSFQKEDGYIFDAFLKRRAFISQLKRFVRTLNPSGIRSHIGGELERAETRQSIAALVMLGGKPRHPVSKIPRSKELVEKYLEALDWNNPWGAGSHFSHLLFFLHYNQVLFGQDENKDLIEHAIGWVGRLQSSEDGCWYRGKISEQQKVNGAMKVMTGLDAAHKLDGLRHVEKIIDTCLATVNDQEACSHFNVVYALYKCSLLSAHRREEIERYAAQKLSDYRDYYYPESGGFSFNKHRSGTHYLGAKLSKGFHEPDIHGTVMFLFGITLISKVLDFDLGLREPIS